MPARFSQRSIALTGQVSSPRIQGMRDLGPLPFLVTLAARDVHGSTRHIAEGQMIAVDRHQLGAAQSPGEAGEKQGTIPNPRQARGAPRVRGTCRTCEAPRACEARGARRACSAPRLTATAAEKLADFGGGQGGGGTDRFAMLA